MKVHRCLTGYRRRAAVGVFMGVLLWSGLTAVARSETTRAPGADAGQISLYIGTYTMKTSRGIYLSRLDMNTGQLRPAELVGEAPSPSFLAVHPTRPVLYAVNETEEYAGKNSGAVSAFSIQRETGRLRLLGQQATEGGGPCHLTVDATGKYVLVANYGGGSIACFPIEVNGAVAKASSFVQHQGSSVNRQRQQAPHAHWIGLDATNRLAFVADLGLDKLLVYRFDASNGKLVPHDPAFASLAAGAGPRHMAFHPNGRYAYVINELSSTITILSYDQQRGEFKRLQDVSTLPPGFAGHNTTAEIAVHPSGKYLYGSNRGHDSLVAFAIDPSTGGLHYLQHMASGGKTPRSFAIDPTGRYVLAANQDSDNVVTFRIEPETGKLKQAGGGSLKVSMPVCVVFWPAA